MTDKTNIQTKSFVVKDKESGMFLSKDLFGLLDEFENAKHFPTLEKAQKARDANKEVVCRVDMTATVNEVEN